VLSIPSAHPVVLFATDSGEVKAFAIGEYHTISDMYGHL